MMNGVFIQQRCFKIIFIGLFVITLPSNGENELSENGHLNKRVESGRSKLSDFKPIVFSGLLNSNKGIKRTPGILKLCRIKYLVIIQKLNSGMI